MIEYTVYVYPSGSKSWCLNGKLHREDGPAVEYASGSKYWYLKGEIHREDGPAVEYASGGKSWWLNGKLHREDGPAVEYASGSKSWWLNDKCVTEEEVLGTKEVDYAEFVESMILTEGPDRLVENTLGLVGEAGEVAEKIKKKVRDGNIDLQGLQKELGDVIFYWYALHGALGLDPETTKSMNKEKLTSRKERGTLQGSGDNR
jgi:NTP pyrophosphatase (non-canonical NTP hydrolase)